MADVNDFSDCSNEEYYSGGESAWEKIERERIERADERARQCPGNNLGLILIYLSGQKEFELLMREPGNEIRRAARPRLKRELVEGLGYEEGSEELHKRLGEMEERRYREAVKDYGFRQQIASQVLSWTDINMWRALESKGYTKEQINEMMREYLIATLAQHAAEHRQCYRAYDRILEGMARDMIIDASHGFSIRVLTDDDFSCGTLKSIKKMADSNLLELLD
jgi:hypothetical protein